MSDQGADDGIVKLVTRPELETLQEQGYLDEAHAEAIAMLENALDNLRGRKFGNGSRVTGLAISFAFEDGSYGRLIPCVECRAAALIGAVATTQHDLILRTLVPG